MKKSQLLLLFAFLNATIACAQKTILWQIKHPASQKVSYLLGTFHQMGNWFIDEKPMIKELLLKSDMAIFECVEDGNEKIVAVMKARPDDFSYRSVLDPADVTFLESHTAKWSIPLSKQKPAEFLIKITQNYIEENCGNIKPTDSFKHMDNYLESIARNHNMKLLGLETYADQFNAINSTKEGEITWQKAKDPVHQWVENLQKKKHKDDVCAGIKNYLKMKFDYQFKVKCAENDPMVSKRNEKWIPKIIENISAYNAFIAVGLFHLYGDCGIITQLRNKGYEVNPISIK